MNANGNGAGILELTEQELEALADQTARNMLHVASRVEAFAMLDRGELAGTAAEAELRSLRFLLGA